MSPVNHVATSAESDNEATAELPVLDVAVYEASLDDAISRTDSIPTLRAADVDTSLSGTHEMPLLAKPAVRHAPEPIVKESPPPSPPIIDELRNALGRAERRIEELTERARIADAERGIAIARANAECAQLRERLGERLESQHSEHTRQAVRHADERTLEDELFARTEHIRMLERVLDAQRRASDEQGVAFAALQRRCESLESDLAHARAGIARRDSQIALIEADMRTRQEQSAVLNARLSDALTAIEPNVPLLRAELALREERIRVLAEQLAQATARNAERDQDLEVAEESIRNLEIELRDKTGKLSEANVAVEEWRAVIAESQRSIQQRDSRIQQLETDLERRSVAIVESTAHTSEEVALEGPARVLIRTDGNTEFVHVLGRRTRIGRGADNELVLDTKHVSRYHAVLLAGPVHTSIEDLNSTNGVFVNGKRVNRQALKDGDKVTIGRSHFRYTVRG
jgi:chromosome segregation ATPase